MLCDANHWGVLSSASSASFYYWSADHNVKLSRNSCIINVESLYVSSVTLSRSEIASSKAYFAIFIAMLALSII